MTTTPDDGTDPGRAYAQEPQTAELTLTLQTSGGIGAARVKLGDRILAVPFVLGPLRGTAHLRGDAPDVGYALASGMATTEWRVTVVPEGEFAVADLLEAFGAEVTR